MLRSDGQALLSQIRESLEEMRRLRSQLREGSPAGAEPSGYQSQEPDVQERYGLTPRELEVAALLAQGLSNGSIAASLGISPHTARHHTQRVLAKLQVHSRSAAGAKLRDALAPLRV